MRITEYSFRRTEWDLEVIHKNDSSEKVILYNYVALSELDFTLLTNRRYPHQFLKHISKNVPSSSPLKQ